MAARKSKRPTAQAKASDAAAPAGGGLRTILTGRTGLDARFRLDPGVELIRARTPLEAVGELARALEHDGRATNVVVVAASCDPLAEGAEGEAAPEPDARRQFLESLRRLDPDVRVLYVDDDSSGRGGQDSRGTGSRGMEDYDGMLRPNATPDDLRALLNGEEAVEIPLAMDDEGADGKAGGTAARAAASPPAAGVPVQRAVPGQGDVPSGGGDAAPVAAASAGVVQSDENLVRFLLQGQEITDAALDLIRHRLGTSDVSFVANGENGEPGGKAPVGWRGRILGHLHSRSVSPQRLEPHAAWLAAWLVLREQHAQLREAAFTDSLTGAHNRRYFDQFLNMAMEEARRERRGVTLLIFDIDDFKKFNDLHGHAAGDDILCETVRLLRSVIRPSDKVCRIGGDEFAVIFYEPDGPRTPSSRPPSDVCEIAERFQREIAMHKFPKLGREAPGPLTISGGLATYPWDGMTARDLLGRADELAMQSKKAGKNCITIGPGAEAGDAAIE